MDEDMAGHANRPFAVGVSFRLVGDAPSGFVAVIASKAARVIEVQDQAI